jgi:hypothetical protein
MIRRAAIACGLAAHLIAASAAAQAPTFTSGVSVVRFDVLASDGRRPITGLEGTDFEVFDRGVPQTVDAVFGESEPLDILFAFDRSASTSGDTIARLRDSARAIVATLHPDDRAGLLAFNNRFQLVSPLGPPEGLSEALETLRPESGTALLEQARSSDAVLYAVAMEARREAAANAADTDAQLRRLAEATGGRLLRADRPEQLRERFLDLMGEMRARYVLTYMPTNGDVPGWHDVRVRLRGRSGRISTRAGYVVPHANR